MTMSMTSLLMLRMIRLLLLVILTLLAGSTYGALPPGFEDELWCPPGGYCDRMPPGIGSGGFAGPQNAFHECYNPENDTVVDEVWTGALTNVTAPEGWIEPERCCSEFTTCLDCLNQSRCDAWSDGQCFSSCSLAPRDISCWSQEYIDESPESICTMDDKEKADNELCSSQTDCESCKGAATSDGGNKCQWFEDGFCSNGCGMDGCGIETCSIAECFTDGDCVPKIRSRTPTLKNHTGVGMCGCYAASTLVLFDECEGENSTCPIAKCAADACDGKEATCDAGTCSFTVAGMANPASVHCEENGGTSEIRTGEAGGQYGVCLFEDGSECDEWAFVRDECSPCSAATTCLDCLNQDGCDAWSVGTCFTSCSEGPTDTSCWSQKYTNSTPQVTCTLADNEKADNELCKSQGDCKSCKGAATSDGGNNCQWFADGFCSNGCGMNGCGIDTCADITGSTVRDDETSGAPIIAKGFLASALIGLVGFGIAN